MLIKDEKGRRVCYLYSPIVKSKWFFGLDLRKSIIVITAGFISLPFFKGGLLSFIIAFVIFEAIAIYIAFFEFEGLTLENYLLILLRYRDLPHYAMRTREKGFFFITKLKTDKREEEVVIK